MRLSTIAIAVAILALAGCSSPAAKRETYDLINAEMAKASESQKKPATADVVSASLLPPLQIEMPRARQQVEERFNLSFNNAPANQFFMAIVSGTRYNMLVHPDVTGVISANLKDVTLFETLDSIREVYGYDYKVEGTSIYIKPLTMQTRVFQVNYLLGNRRGSSDIRVTSGSVSTATTPGTQTGASGTTPNAIPGQPGTTTQAVNSSRISTTSNTDFWDDLKLALEAIVGVAGNKDGARSDHRSVVISPQSGVVVVRAMPEDMRNVTAYLNASQLSVARQVILEAKILEVQLNDTYQAGINWASFASFGGSSKNRTSLGFVGPGTTLSPIYTDGSVSALSTNNGLRAVSGTALGAAGVADTAGAALGSLFGLAFQTSNFAALLSFLESQGNVQVLSSPRIATMNNQKAVLKVGTDEFFVTKLTTTPGTVSGSTTTAPITTVDVQPFFSGVSLDVTPQIDESGNIILHIHPQVSKVTTVDKIINLGVNGTLTLPLASSDVSETDSVVRGQDGNIIAIGGLMRQSTTADRSQVPGVGNVPVLGELFRNTNQVTQKRELVILLKPTIVNGASSWSQDMQESQRRIKGLDRMPPQDFN